MAKIHRLDRHIADLIAAGEVVERPASVVKELVENSIDAGATAITVEIKRGGLELIRVTDNGCGIAPDDVATAFLRHATSKIGAVSDLDAIRTMGFRGEALASVAAVSRVRILTREVGALVGTSYTIEGGDAEGAVEAGCPEGTTITVRELFFNTPARMKYIKRDVTEAGQVLSTVRRAALAHPDVAFRFVKDGEGLLSTPGNGDLRDAVYAVYGGVAAAGMVVAAASSEGVEVRGYVSKPQHAQGNRTRQEFFVNGRPVRSRVMGAALEEAYKNSIMHGRFPACVLHLTIAPQTVDVNVHPAKLEVKFAYERAIFDVVYLAARSAIDTDDARVELSTRKPLPFANEPQTTVQTSIPKTAGFSPIRNERPSKNQVARTEDFYKAMTASEYRAAYAPDTATVTETVTPLPLLHQTPAPQPAEVRQPSVGVYQTEVTQAPPALPTWRIAGEVFATYIVVEDGDEVLFVDKHAAHERIIFQRLKAADTAVMSQVLLTPIVVTPDREERDTLDSNSELLREVGFEIDDFGGGSLIIRAVPSEIDGSDGAAALQEIAQRLSENRRLDLVGRREEALNLVACKAALKAGSVTTPAERYALVERVLSDDEIRYCPHGRPIVSLIKRGDLERGMGRRT